MIDDILKIKKIREDQALSNLAKARGDLADRLRARDEAKARADDFRRRRPAMEDDLYDAISGRLVGLKSIDETREKVSALRLRELRLFEEVERLDQEVSKARQRVADAERERTLAHRDVEKYEELKEREAAEKAAVAELRQETEIEDMLAGKRRG